MMAHPKTPSTALEGKKLKVSAYKEETGEVLQGSYTRK